MLTKIAAYTQTNSSKASISRFILDHLGEIEKLSLDEIAKESFTSKPSVVRFAQGLGFKGWTDFLPELLAARYYSETHFSDIDHNLPFTESDESSAIIQKIATIEKESIQETADKLVPEEIEGAAELMRQASRIVLFGLSPNEYIAHLFKRKMLAIGKRIEVAHISEFGLMSATLSQDDVAMIISYSGNSPKIDSLSYIPLLKKKGVKIIGLTSQNGDYLRTSSDYCFTICTREETFKKIGTFSTEESILFILNSLYAIYFKQDYFSNYVRKITLAKELEDDRQ